MFGIALDRKRLSEGGTKNNDLRPRKKIIGALVLQMLQNLEPDRGKQSKPEVSTLVPTRKVEASSGCSYCSSYVFHFGGAVFLFPLLFVI